MAGTKKRKRVGDDINGDDDDDDDGDATYQEESVKKKAVRKPRTTKKTKKSARPTENLLMKLPGELRNRIYELVLPSDETVYIRPRGHMRQERGRWDAEPDRFKQFREPALLRVSKTIREETLKLFYQLNDFAIVAYSHESGSIYDFLRAKSAGDHGAIAIHWSVRFIAPNLRDMAHWLALAQAIWLTAAAYKNRRNIRNAREPHQSYCAGATALFEVNSLACKARKRGLKQKELVRDFLDWAVVKLNMSPELKASDRGRRVADDLARLTGGQRALLDYQGYW